MIRAALLLPIQAFGLAGFMYATFGWLIVPPSQIMGLF
jgi:hypothetical protein